MCNTSILDNNQLITQAIGYFHLLHNLIAITMGEFRLGGG